MNIPEKEKWGKLLEDVDEKQHPVVAAGLNQVDSWVLASDPQNMSEMLLPLTKEVLVRLAASLGEDLAIVERPAFVDGRGNYQLVSTYRLSNVEYWTDRCTLADIPKFADQIANELIILYSSCKKNKRLKFATLYFYVPVFTTITVGPEKVANFWTRCIVS